MSKNIETMKPMLYAPVYNLNYTYSAGSAAQAVENKFAFDLHKLPNLLNANTLSISALFIKTDEPKTWENMYSPSGYFWHLKEEFNLDIGFVFEETFRKPNMIEDLLKDGKSVGITLGGAIHAEDTLDPIVECTEEELYTIIVDVDKHVFGGRLSFVDFDYENASTFNDVTISKSVYEKLTKVISRLKTYRSDLGIVLTISAYSDTKWKAGYSDNTGLKSFVENNLETIGEFNFMLMHYYEWYKENTAQQMIKNMKDTMIALGMKDNVVFQQKLGLTFRYNEFGPNLDANDEQMNTVVSTLKEDITNNNPITVNIFEVGTPETNDQPLVLLNNLNKVNASSIV